MLTRIQQLLFALACMMIAGLSARAGSMEGLTLYERMGGANTVAVVANELIDETAAHPDLKRSFEGVNIPRVKTMLIEQLCNLTGGPCTYSGDTMIDVHAGLKITEAEMNGMVEILRSVLIRHGVNLRERNELLALLAPMKRDVVTQ